MLFGNKMTGVKLKDKQDLENKKAKVGRTGHMKYWTALRYEKINIVVPRML